MLLSVLFLVLNSDFSKTQLNVPLLQETFSYFPWKSQSFLTWHPLCPLPGHLITALAQSSPSPSPGLCCCFAGWYPLCKRAFRVALRKKSLFFHIVLFIIPAFSNCTLFYMEIYSLPKIGGLRNETHLRDGMYM